MTKTYKSDEVWSKWIKGIRRLPIRFRLTRLPIIGKYLSRKTFVGDPTTKAWLVPVREDVDLPNSVHLPLDVVRPLIEKSAFRAISPICVCREGFGCKNYPHSIGCLALGGTLLNVEDFGEKFSTTTVQKAIAHVEKAVNMGLTPTIIWEKEIQAAFGIPKNKGLAICLCCNCCCDYRLGLRVGNKIFRKKVFRPEGVSLVVSDACELCGDCTKQPGVCSVQAITLGTEKAEIDLDKCVGCGACVRICPQKAISFCLDPEVDVVGKLLAKVEQYTDIT